MHARSHILVLTAVVVAVLPTCLPAQQGESLLVSARQLARELNDPSLVLLQVGPKDDYDAGHIPGTRHILMQDLAAPRASGAPTLELPDESGLRARLEQLGIGDDRRVVVIPGADWISPATRIVWTLQAAGLGARTRLLEGGSDGWKRAGLVVTREVPPPPTPGRLTARPDRSIVVDHAWVQSQLNAPGFRLVDARAPMFYEGPGMDHGNGNSHGAGHIPGAKNVPFNTLFDDSLQVLPRDQLRRAFAAAGVQPGDTVVAYCHIGQQATVVLFAARVLGHPVKLYDGSFTDWEARKLPVENLNPGRPPESRTR
jgi:thiosulfate/3-mercaptopyruvate sulfurtransferase